MIVVTGAAGFIGRNVVAELNLRGRDDLLLVDNLGRDEKWRNLVGLHYEDIIESQDFLARLQADTLPGIEGVIHLGACSATTERDAGFLLRNNYHYTRTLCEWTLRHKVRFIYASSAATYGDGSQGYDDDLAALDRLQPLNMYGYSKHMFDLWAHRYGFFNRIVGLRSQGRHALGGAQVLPANQEYRRRQTVQVLSAGIRRRGTVARFHLRQGCRGDDAVLP
jgi:ADP-L-glycero-D-manno-heptose 6-epimerase